MADLFRMLDDNFAVMFGASVAWVVLLSAFFAWRRYKAGPIHPPFADADVLFAERHASGFSHRNAFTRLSGARNALVVKVLRAGLLVEPIAIFKWVMPIGFADLEHFVPQADIRRVELVTRFGRDGVLIEFRGRDGALHTIELSLRDPQGFLTALRA